MDIPSSQPTAQRSHESLDLVVIGAGPSGLLAAATAAQHGATVTLLERMDRPGRKLCICGHGRGNIGNAAPLDDFLRHFGKNFRFLRPACAHFFTPHTVALFEKLDVPTKVEADGRIFPCSDNAQDLVDALIRHARAQGVHIHTTWRVQTIDRTDQGFRITNTQGRTLAAHRLVLATGGASYPATGSTGDGYVLAQSLGHALTPIAPALIPLITAGDTASRLQGVALKNVRAEVRLDGKKCAENTGEMLFTHFGLSGPIILALSREAVRGLAAKRRVEVILDLHPGLDPAAMDARLLQEIAAHGKKQLGNLLHAFLPPKLIPVCLEQTQLDASIQAMDVTAPERKRLRLWLNELRFTITGHRPLREAIITAGGVPLTEVNPKTMESRICPGLYLAGEVLDMDAETGGFNLQAALSSGHLAGFSASTSP